MSHVKGKEVVGALMVMVLAFALICTGCTTQQTAAKVGDTVNVTYTVTLEDGTVFESNENSTPLQVTIGSGQLIQGFDDALAGMHPGETKMVTIPPENAYGEYKSEMVNEIDTLQGLESLVNLRKSGRLQPYARPGFDSTFIWQRPDGSLGYVTFSNITDTSVTVDENHPLAGRYLTFEISLRDITPADASGT